jgi:hypothetical protein
MSAGTDIGVPTVLWQGHESFPDEIKRLLAQDLRECRYSREQVADELSRLMGRTITVAQIDAYTAATKTHRFPAEMIPAWIQVTGSTRILATICRQAGVFLADEEEHKAAEYGRAIIERERLEMRIAGLKSRLWGNA